MAFGGFKFTMAAAVGCAVLVVTLIVGILFSLARIQDAQTRLEYLNGQLQSGDDIIKIQQDLIRDTQIRIRNVALVRDPVALKQELDKLQEARHRYDESEQVVDRLFADEQSHPLVEKARALRASGRAVLDGVMQLALKGEREAAAARLLNELAPLTKQRLEVLSQLSDVQDARRHATAEEAALAHRQVRMLMYVIGGLATFLGLLVAAVALFLAVGVDQARRVEEPLA
jgi:methyl-accepting chemotaxis protein